MNALIQFGDRMHRSGGRPGFHPLGMLLCLLLVGGIVALVMWAFRSRRPATAPAAPAAVGAPSPTANAEAILAERLARGEVSPDDYRSTLSALRGGVVAPAAEPEAPQA